MEHKLLYGAGAVACLPFARSRIKAIRATGLQHCTQSYVIDSYTVRIRISGEHEFISVSSNEYMESGFQNLKNLLPAFKETFMPATVHFSGAVAAISNNPVPNSVGRALVDGDESWSTAGSRPADKIKEVTYYVGINPIVHTSATPIFAKDPEAILAAKRLRYENPPSVFTGRLMAYVQALYGSDRTDYKAGDIETGGGSNQIAIDTGGTYKTADGTVKKIYAHLLWSYPTSGLLMDKDENYYLVTFGPGGLKWRKMNRTHHVDASYKISHPLEYMVADLSTLVPDPVEHTSTIPYTPAGSPLAYGWKFHPTGNEAIIVTLTTVPLTGKAMYSGAEATIDARLGQIYTATFEIDQGEVRFSLSKGVGGPWVSLDQTKVFTPSFSGTGVDLVLPGSGYPWNCAVDAEGPAYCIYNDGAPVVVMVNNSSFTIIPEKTGLITTSGGSIWGQNIVSNCLDRLATHEQHGVAYDFGVYGKHWPLGKTEYYFVLKDYGPIFLVSGHPADWGSWLTNNTICSQIRDVYPTLDERASNYVVIPHGHANAYFTGSTYGRQDTNKTQTQYIYGNNTFTRTERQDPARTYTWGGGFSDPAWSARPAPFTDAELKERPDLYTVRDYVFDFNLRSAQADKSYSKESAVLLTSALASANYTYPTVSGAWRVDGSFRGSLKCLTVPNLTDEPRQDWPEFGDIPVGWA